jgi:hypothetical protein
LSTPWNPSDFPPWLRLPQPGDDDVSADEPTRDVHLHSLVLAFHESVAVPKPVVDFLHSFASTRDLDPADFGLGHFMHEVWPDGLPTTVYAANIGNDPSAASHIRDLLLRPVCEGPLALHPAVGGLTLGLQVYRRQGKLVVRRVEVTPHVVLRDFEARVTAPIRWVDPDAYMNQGDFDALAGLPFQRAITRDRLADWRRYLDWKEKLIRANQVSVPYAAWRWEDDTVLSFLVHEDDLPERRIEGMELGAAPRPVESDEDDEDDEAGDQRRRRKRRRDPEVTQLGEVDSKRRLNLRDAGDREGWGEVKLTPKHGCVRIRLDEDSAETLRRRGPPEEGQLLSSIAGDLAPLQNQKGGVNRLNNNQGFSPRLADFVFSSTGASVPFAIPELPPEAGMRELNPGQRDAVAKALAAPDLCLIQGPPGTGKTTVIAEICLRATREGKRVLVASQTNLAVDNALARLADVPWVRPLRLGDPGKVDEEFRDFLAENVVTRWFATIADHCRGRMRSAEQDELQLADQERAVERMRKALTDYDQAAEGLRRARQATPAARQALAATANGEAQARIDVDHHKRRRERLAALTRWAVGQGPLPPGAGSEPWPRELALPHGLSHDQPPAVMLDRSRQRLEPLTAALQAIDAAMSGAVADVAAAEELRSLREEKAVLVDSEEDADMRRLRLVNRRMKELEGSGWNHVTGGLHRAARSAWPVDAPTSITAVVDSLAPSADTAAALVKAKALVVTEIRGAKEAEAAIARSEASWQGLLATATTALDDAQDAVVQAQRALTAAQTVVDAALAEEARCESAVRDAIELWETALALTGDLGPAAPPSSPALAAAVAAVGKVRAAHADRLKRATRWRAVQGEWIDRLGRVTDSDREQLQALYVRHSNVVGMTCNEAGKRNTWQDPEFKPFDIVIVDEVSKATPPELILPLLLGEKAILVGDHRQLPPMFRERDATFGEAAEEGEVSKEDFESFRRMVTASLFEELFEQAPDDIKAMLWTQYRMHPRIMDAVNQFYEGRLEPGPNRDALATARVHHLDVPASGGGRLLAPNQHLLWIDSSKAPDGSAAWEEQRGSSKLNWLEIDIITALLVRFGQALGARGYGPTREIEVARTDAGGTWKELLRRACADIPVETLDDLFQERRIRVDGRAQKPNGIARAGAVIHVRAQKEVGVITFYGAQLKELRNEIDRARSKHRDVFAAMELRTNTVDRFQGMEKPIILASLVRAKNGKLGDFVREFQRINVGLSRAQQLLVVVGAEDTWKHAEVPLPPLDGGPPKDVPVYRNILELARQAGGRRLARQVLLP